MEYLLACFVFLFVFCLLMVQGFGKISSIKIGFTEISQKINVAGNY
jgi:hypothetical protein